MFTTLDDVGPHTRDVIGNVTQVGPLLGTLYTFTDNLALLQHAIETGDNATLALQTTGRALKPELATLSDSISDDSSLCSPAVDECARVLALLPDLDMGVDYDDLGDLGIAVLAIHYVINDDIMSQVRHGLDEFNNIAGSITTTWTAQVQDAKTKANQIETEINTLIGEVSTQIRDLNLSDFSNQLDDYKEPLQTFGDYRFYASIGLTVILGLIVVLIYIGLACGTCCKRPSYYKKITCSTRCGSNALLAAVGTIFIFAWIQMLVTLVLFVSGGVIYTELCRHLNNMAADPVVGVVDRMMMQTFNLSLSIQNVTAKCEKNASVYDALELERHGVNISDVLNVENYGMSDVINRFKRVPVDIGDVVIFSQATNDTLQVLEIGMETVNFTQFTPVLARNITQIDLRVLASELDAAAAQISIQPLSSRLSAHASTLRTLESSTIAFLRDTRDNLTRALDDVKRITEDTPIPKLIHSLTDAQDNLNANGNDLIRGVVNATVDDLMMILSTLMTSLDDDIRNDVGRCQPLYAAVTGVIDVGCVNILYPLNGFWAAHGWSLILFIPMIVMALKLAGYYRVALSFSSVSEGAGGDRNAIPYDAYANAPNAESEVPETSRDQSDHLILQEYRKMNTLDRESHA